MLISPRTMNMIRLTPPLFALALAAACSGGEGNDDSNAGGSSGSSTGGTAGSSTGGSGGSSTAGTGGSPSGGNSGSSTGGSSQDAGGTTDGGPDANADAGGADSGSSDGGQPGLNCAMPNDGLLAVFRVAGTEYFSAQITDPVGMQQAIDLWTGASTANIPNGALICEPADYNCGYTWHLDPADIQFADFTIELCDGTPSYLEDHCAEFGARYCTWAGELIELYDCRINGCPLVPK